MDDKFKHTYVPFTDDEVESLNEYQASGVFHPFTCRDSGTDAHQDRVGEDRGQLIAHVDGWWCKDCSYHQNWAWKWMADWSWKDLVLLFRE